MKLEQVVPFGRSFDEYRKLFNLSQDDLFKQIVGVGDGPASFNAEMAKLGHQIVSIDPLYSFTGQEIERRFYEVVDDVIEQVRRTPSDWVWAYHQSPEDLRDNRITALRTFLTDYELGKIQKRYRLGGLPHLSDVDDDVFDLALCSHFLFLYSERFDFEFHKAAVCEMLRVAREVRIFPLMTLMLERSPYVFPLVQWLREQGYEVRIQKVQYELQRGGNEMLWAKRG